MAATRPIAGLTFGKKILLKTIAAAREYSWKSRNSIAVPSQPDTAAFVRSRVVRVTTPVGAVRVLSVISCPVASVTEGSPAEVRLGPRFPQDRRNRARWAQRPPARGDGGRGPARRALGITSRGLS